MDVKLESRRRSQNSNEVFAEGGNMKLLELTPGKDCQVILKPAEYIHQSKIYADNNPIAFIGMGVGLIIKYTEDSEEKCIKIVVEKKNIKGLIRHLKRLCRWI